MHACKVIFFMHDTVHGKSVSFPRVTHTLLRILFWNMLGFNMFQNTFLIFQFTIARNRIHLTTVGRILLKIMAIFVHLLYNILPWQGRRRSRINLLPGAVVADPQHLFCMRNIWILIGSVRNNSNVQSHKVALTKSNASSKLRKKS
jgi:hypothetical protein